MLSAGGRIVLINSVLSSLPLFMLSFFRIPKGVLRKSRLFKLLNEEGLWQDLLRKKYLKNKTLSQVEKRKGDSQFWSGLMEVKKDFFGKGSVCCT